MKNIYLVHSRTDYNVGIMVVANNPNEAMCVVTRLLSSLIECDTGQLVAEEFITDL